MSNKSLSQNWLSDDDSLEAMISAGEVMRDDVILEIGPGLGTLTQKLIKRAKHVVAVEFDRALAENLHVVVPANNLEVIHEDILEFDLSKMPKSYKVVANIPYHITAPIVRHLLESDNPPSLIALLVQKEVAERLAAAPGKMSILAIAAQLYADVTLKEVIGKELFVPSPKVDSQIIQLRRLDSLRLHVDRRVFFRLVKAGFSEKRKKLTNTLSSGLQLEKTKAEELLNKSGIDNNARAQELSFEQWGRLYEAYQSQQ